MLSTICALIYNGNYWFNLIPDKGGIEMIEIFQFRDCVCTAAANSIMQKSRQN